MRKSLIICGPTATGKTKFGLDIAQKLSGEILSADSRQVYVDMDIVTGKDLSKKSTYYISDISWKGRSLKYYEVNNVRIWLYDIVHPNEQFNVSYWNECARLVLENIATRNKLPIVVGGTGLYIKSLTASLDKIKVPINPHLRLLLEDKNQDYLFDYLNKLDSSKAANLNRSDRFNPRRLIRAIEIASHQHPTQQLIWPQYNFLQIGLTAPRQELYNRVNERVLARLKQGAQDEALSLAQRYDSSLPSMAACGYPALLTNDPISKWQFAEHSYVRRQLTWFKKQPFIRWFDITLTDWRSEADLVIESWYNSFKLLD